MNRLLLLTTALLALGLLGLLAGCSTNMTKSPRSCAEGFISLMKAGKYKDAALLWDYDEQARRDNENWDEIVESQRKLIIGKLADDKAEAMKMWSTRFAGDIKVVEVSESGESAQAQLNGGGITSLDLVKIGDEWRIAGIN